MESSHPSRENRSRRRHWELLLLLLALLMSFACVFLSSWISLNTWPDRVKASMLAGEGADYKRSDQEDVAFGSLNPEVGAEAATDAARLQLTPENAGRSTPAGIALLPVTPTPPLAAVTTAPNLTPPPPPPTRAAPTATQAPIPANTPTPAPMPPTVTLTPVPPTPTGTRTATVEPPTPTGTATSEPPTPTDTATSVPPTATKTATPHSHRPTNTPVLPTDTPTPTSTSTPSPTPSPTPSSTPSSTPTNTPVAPTVSAIRPRAALLGSSVPVTIIGNNFEAGLQAVLGSASLLNVTWTSATTLTAVVPPTMSVGLYTLTVTNPGPTNLSDSLSDAFQVITYTVAVSVTCSGNVGTSGAGDCSDGARVPDGSYDGVNDAGGVITFDFGSPGITNGPGYDLVFYERAYAQGIQLDYITIEVSTDGVTWTTLFNWDGFPGGVNGTSIDSYAADANGEVYNEIIPTYDLYPGIPGGPSTGIAMDIGAVGVDSVQYIRVKRPDGNPGPPPRPNEPAEVDAIVRLN